MAVKGIVFNIQRFTVHDGPGIRTEVFLKGCPLACLWCSNPESGHESPEVGVYPCKCIGLYNCGLCVQACPAGCLRFEEGKLTALDRDRCTGCMRCVEACPSVALKAWGQAMSTEEVMKIIRKDIPFYRRSHGGVTFSGGEPLVQSDFLVEVLQQCKGENIHTCVETALAVDEAKIAAVLPYTDLFIADLKLMDAHKHRHYIGSDNVQILENLKRLSNSGVPLILRMPVIPGVNDDAQNAKQTANFILEEMGGRIESLQLLPYLSLGEEKFRSLDRAYPMADLNYDKDEFDATLQQLKKIFVSSGIHCTIGSKTAQKEIQP